MSEDFIRRNGLWTPDQEKQALEIRRRVETEKLQLVRLAWADPHGAARAKTVSVAAFHEALENGYNINVATSTLDGAGGRVFSSFTRGGGMDLDEMTGSPNLVIVPDPQTFRVLPWADGVGWILCDEYFRDGRPFHFSSRHLLRRQVERLQERNYRHVVGLEAEWYLAHRVQERLTHDNIGMPGLKGRAVETLPVEPGYSYHSETHLDRMQPVLSELAQAYRQLDLPLRSLENEFGPGQVECTFFATDAMLAADNYVLFRTATRQVCHRLGYFASFMCRPALAGHFSSGWHLHQSLAKVDGTNLFTPQEPEAPDAHLSETGRAFLAGLLQHAVPATLFATPTVNGYRRFRPNSLAPDRVSWGFDHRGVLMRVLGGAGDADSRIENRAGEPAANPYLFIASQIAAGLDGIDKATPLPPADDSPYEAARPPLPANIQEALDALGQSELFRDRFGGIFIDYYLKLKAAELERFSRYCEEHNIVDDPDVVTQWEHNEYYDFF